ncbi:HET domain protein [Nemania diffusa]|nr:HET domain protein [Nemania diffusa]
MGLINVGTLTLEEFMIATPNTIHYPILSHTWEDEEVTFSDFTYSNPHGENKKGFSKIKKTCSLARRDSLRYAWIDTCCIDKTSSAELTEAINSMFNWYQDAKVCYAWLADLPAAATELIGSSLRNCRWFTRGWTLQELLAPRHVEFYDGNWVFRGTKRDLKELDKPEGLYRLPITEEMSWAAKRQTTRLEEMAYCLLGIFEVNMPMLYGEGQRAFLRLQEKIVKETNDLSIFAQKAATESQKYHGVFARRPAKFRECGSFQLADQTISSPEFSLENKGLRIQTDVISDTGGSHLLNLNCKNDPRGSLISIWVHHHGSEVYSRSRACEYGDLGAGDPRPLTKKSIYILKQFDALQAADLEASHRHAFVFRRNFNMRSDIQLPDFPFVASMVGPPSRWDASRRMLHTQMVDKFAGFVYFTSRQTTRSTMAAEWFLIVLGRGGDEDGPWIAIYGWDDARAVKLLRISSADVQRMGRGARERLGAHSVALKGLAKGPFKKVSVALHEGTLDGGDVYFVDVEFEDLPAPTQDTPCVEEAIRRSYR